MEYGSGRSRLVLHLIRMMKTVSQGHKGKVTVAVMSSRLKEANEVFPLFNFFLDFVTGGRNFCLCGEDSTDKGEDCAPGGSVKGPAQGAVSRFVGGCISSTVDGFLAAPACRVEDQAEDKEQTCDSLQEPADVENAFPHDALHAHGEDGHQSHYAENEDPHGQENSGSLPEAAGYLPKALGVGPAQCVSRDLLHGRGAEAEDAQVVGLRVHACLLVAAAGLGFPDQPVGAHEGNEFSKGHHDTQEGPEHRAAGDNDMTHIDVHGGKARLEVHGVNPERQL